MTLACLAGVGLVVAGCASGHAGGTQATGTPSTSAVVPAGQAAAGPSAAMGTTPAKGAGSAGNAATGVATATETATDGSAVGQRPGALWLESVRMVSADGGWALAFRQNPASAGPDPVLLVKTSDGGRTWADVTPSAARRRLTTPGAAQVLDATDAEHAYLVVSAATEDTAGARDTAGTHEAGSARASAAVFVTGDGGRTWTGSAPFGVAGPPVQVTFADAAHGWVLLDAAADASGHPLPWLYRTTDGRHWAPAASAEPPGSGGMNDMCQKLGLAFTGPAAGWLHVSCRSGDFLVRSRDGGSTWQAQVLPLPGGCAVPGAQCTVFGPQLSGGTAFVTIAPMTTVPAPALLASADLGRAWRQIGLPSGAGQYPRVSFFTPADGLLVAMGAQQVLGAVFYTTRDGGSTWSAVPQGRHFTQLGASVDFANARDGIEWTEAGDAQGAQPPPLYATGDSGRTWSSFVPVLTG